MTVPAADPPQELVSSWLQYGHYAPPADATKSPFRNEARSESDYARHSIQQSSITATSEPESEPRHEPEPEPEPAQIPSHADQKSLISRSSDYKPTALRWWYHAILIVCLAVLIGLTEYALHTLNVHQDGLDDFVSDQMAAKRSVIRDSRALQQAHVEPRDNVPPSAMDRNSAADRLGSLNFMHPDLVRAASLGNPIQSRGTPAHTRSCEPCDEVLQDSAPREEYLDPGQETLYVYEQKRTVTTTSQTFQHAPSTAGVLQQPTGMTTAEALPAVARKEWYLNPGPETVYETVFLLKRTSTALPATANSEPAALAALYRDGDFGTEGHAVEGLYLDPSRVTTQYLIPRDLQTTATDLSATHTGTSLVTKDNVNDPDTGYTKQDNQPLSNVLSHDTSTSNAGSSSSHLPTGQSTGSEKQPLLAPIAEPKGFARAMPSVHAGESLNNPEKYVKLGEETIVWHGKRATQPASTVESTIALPVMTPTWEQYVADGVIALLSSSVFHPETSLIVSTIGQRTALESALATATIGGMSQESATLTEPNAFLTTGKTTIQVTVEASSTVSTTSDVVPAAPSGESLSTGESTMRIDTETSIPQQLIHHFWQSTRLEMQVLDPQPQLQTELYCPFWYR
ncbi:hypothetical protein BD289DRAFT_455849 [Coniella lustricola]|uniref:Uncharacterized protein n=1 Tax=Coniella lustricola TaxID=2025994 RepID=A0A2T2ZY62_9PEZI|nr:hypothetical protein BD289DRAFT_455849 [Coniella lustricola]